MSAADSHLEWCGFKARAEAAEARLAAVLALCDSVPPLVVYGGGIAPGFVSVERVRAAARGEGDQ